MSLSPSMQHSSVQSFGGVEGRVSADRTSDVERLTDGQERRHASLLPPLDSDISFVVGQVAAKWVDCVLYSARLYLPVRLLPTSTESLT